MDDMGTPGPVATQLHHVHDAAARGLRASQYVYAIGSYHYNWHTALEILVVITGALELCAAGERRPARAGRRRRHQCQ